MPGQLSIGFIGTGIMGFHMARRLAQAGYRITAWNRTEAKAEPLRDYGVDIAATAADAAGGAGIAIVMVADGPSSDEVILGTGENTGILERMRAGSTLLVMSSIPVATAAAQGKAAEAAKVRYLDAPVSGGEPGARDGKLTIMAGGDAQAFEEMQPVFAVMGRSTYIGRAGAGSLAKLANQVIVGNAIQSVAEALLLVQAGGADPKAVIEALTGGFADSPILQNHGSRMIAGDFKPGGRCHTQLKDTRSAQELGTSLGIVMPMTAQARETYANLVENGQGDLDHNAAWLDLRRRSGMGS
ncbi:MAG: NAD(P)-dependent oxidoreductase [Proteobacteria bacterium]|nr:NAD(P)-dependent oxidoreductase [Pseudomonadota bacterium]